MFVSCTVRVPTRSSLHCWALIVFVWCTVDVLSLRSPIAGSFSSLYGVLCACCHSLKMYCQAFCWLVAASTTELLCLLYLSAVTFSCNYYPCLLFCVVSVHIDILHIYMMYCWCSHLCSYGMNTGISYPSFTLF